MMRASRMRDVDASGSTATVSGIGTGLTVTHTVYGRIPPRQNIKCTASIYALPSDPNTNIAGTSQGQRNMLSLRDNLNAIDAINKVVQFTFDGLFSRDVQ